MAELTPKTINELPSATSLSDSDLFAISSGGESKKTLWSTIKTAIERVFFPLSIANGGTGTTTWQSALSNLHITFGGVVTSVTVIHYGGDNGIQLRISDGTTIYALVIYVNALELQTSTDGGVTWVVRWRGNVTLAN